MYLSIKTLSNKHNYLSSIYLWSAYQITSLTILGGKMNEKEKYMKVPEWVQSPVSAGSLL